MSNSPPTPVKAEPSPLYDVAVTTPAEPAWMFDPTLNELATVATPADTCNPSVASKVALTVVFLAKDAVPAIVVTPAVT